MTQVRRMLVILLALLGATVMAGRVAAVTFTVNSVSDVAAALPLDNGVCETVSGNGVCTLRAAIMKANHLAGGGATIVLPASAFPYRISPLRGSPLDDEAWGDLNINAGMTISGAGAANTIVDGESNFRVFRITAPNATVTITGVTIRNGAATAFDFGAVRGGGILLFRGNLILRDSIVRANRANTGGGIYADPNSSLTLTRATIAGNTASTDNEGNGGGIAAEGDITIERSSVLDNHADALGGGVFATRSLVVNDSLFAGNVAAVEGGGLLHGGTATIARSTFAANRAKRGGGIMGFNSQMTVNNTTITANFAGELGGGIGADAGTVMQLFHVTIAGNIVGGKGGGGGVARRGAGTLSLSNSILAENYVVAEGNDCFGSLISQDYNYIQHVTCTISGPMGNTLTQGDVMLDSLRDNGSATPTRALLARSPALDRIPPALCRDYTGAAPVPDQRGAFRPIGVQCDMGAFEGSRLPTLFGRNLIRNGNAEDGGTFPNGVSAAVPSWSPVLDFSAVRYGTAGGFPSLQDLLPLDHGYNFFAGGDEGVAGGLQDVDVKAISNAIDADLVTWSISGDFGGYADQEDYALMFIRFLDATGNKLGTEPVIGIVTAAERGNATGFRQRSAAGGIPAGTRTIHVGLTIRRAASSGYNDGYADNLSLVLSTGAGTRATAIEFKHAAFDHFFVTSIPDEIQKLDRGVFQGWTRVGEAFTVLNDTPADSRPVCRFFSTAFGAKSSHFYAPGAECDIVKRNPNWQFEGEVFSLKLPAADGNCSNGWLPVYRVYNNGQGGAPNHRYTTNPVIRSQMIDSGWVPEGVGIGVAMCAPF